MALLWQRISVGLIAVDGLTLSVPWWELLAQLGSLRLRELGHLGLWLLHVLTLLQVGVAKVKLIHLRVARALRTYTWAVLPVIIGGTGFFESKWI